MLISVVITNYNYSKFLATCIDSVLNQTYENIEIIIIDDFSNDNSVEIIMNFKSIYAKIFTFFNAENKGVVFCRNLGIQMSNGEYICFLDADDYWNPMKIEKQVNIIRGKDISFCDLILIDEFNNYCGTKCHKSKFKEYNFSLLLKYNFIAHSSIMIKKSLLTDICYSEVPVSLFSKVLMKLFLIDNFIHEDYNLLLKIFKIHTPKTAYLPDKLVFYRLHDNNFSKGFKKKFFSILFIFCNSLGYSIFKSLLFTIRLSFITICRKLTTHFSKF